MSSRVKLISVGLTLGVLAGGIVTLDVRRHALLTELAGLKNQKESLTRKHVDHDGSRLSGSPAAGAMAKQVTEELEQARREAAVLEQRAVSRRAEMLAESARRKAADTAAMTSDNRDPSKGLAKLEYLQNVGTETPDAALQTLVWAAMKGDDAVLARGLVLNDRARERAEVVLAGLPENAREQLTPEKLAALWFAGTVLEVPAVHIFGQEDEDSTHVTLLVRGGVGNDQKVPMQLGPTGWQIVVPERAIEGIQKKVIGVSPPLPKR